MNKSLQKIINLAKNRLKPLGLLAVLAVASVAHPGFAADKLPFSIIPQDGKPALVFRIELAVSPETRERGLMFRESLPENEGMLFISGRYQVANMWMKKTLIPLDMVFIDSNKQIVHIHENAVPEDLTVISSEVPVWAVLELAGGVVKKQGIRVGDAVAFPSMKLE